HCQQHFGGCVRVRRHCKSPRVRAAPRPTRVREPLPHRREKGTTMYKHIFATFTFVTLASSFGGCSSDSKSGGGSNVVLDGADWHKITVDPAYPGQKCNNAADRCYLLDHNSDVRKWGGLCATTTEGSTVPGTSAAKGCFSSANLANPDS